MSRGTFCDWGRFVTGDVSWLEMFREGTFVLALGDALHHGSYHQGTFCMYASLLECHEDFQTHRRIHFLGPSRIWIWINKKKSDSDPHQICPELRSCLLVIIVGPMWYIFIVVFYWKMFMFRVPYWCRGTPPPRWQRRSCCRWSWGRSLADTPGCGSEQIWANKTDQTSVLDPDPY